MALSDRDQVRLTIGDTDPTDALLSDTEIDNFLTGRTLGTSVNIPAAAADCAAAIAAKYAREFNFAEDGQNFQRAQRVGHYMALEQQLRKRQGGFSAPVGTGGTIVTT